MSQIAIVRICLLLLTITVVGCGTSNNQTTFDADKQAHPVGWLVTHEAAVPTEASSANCTECHGSELNGGISNISCTMCHMDGPFAAHPTEWADPIALNHSYDAIVSGGKPCANINCHGADLMGGRSGPSCTSCHIGGTMAYHPPQWAHGDYATVNGDQSCRNMYCHGPNLEGVTNSGWACSQCHGTLRKLN